MLVSQVLVVQMMPSRENTSNIGATPLLDVCQRRPISMVSTLDPSETWFQQGIIVIFKSVI